METTELPWRTPLDAFAPLADTPWATLLHAGEGARDPGWSILVAFPSTTLTVREGRAAIDGAESPLDPLAALRALHASRGGVRASPGFRSGLVGFVGYEIGAVSEPAARGPASPYALPDMAFGAYDSALLFDRRRGRCLLSERNPGAGDRLAAAVGVTPRRSRATTPTRLVPPDAPRHGDAVRAARERIAEGDFFQTNLAQTLRLEADAPIDAFAVFDALSAGDAPFGAMLRFGEGAILSASPERFFRIDPMADGRRRIVAEPIKGTRPRGSAAAEDLALAQALLDSAKDRAENVMIADLLRNDIARVADDFSIVEEEICGLRSFATVHHLVSRLSGRLAEGRGVVDAMEALFPCGSVTGAPKIEAMRAIAALEGVGRGPYCGAFGWIDDGGAADFAVAIRTAVVEGRRAFVPVGGGVTLRSEPDGEYEETLVKAAGLLRAFGAAP